MSKQKHSWEIMYQDGDIGGALISFLPQTHWMHSYIPSAWEIRDTGSDSYTSGDWWNTQIKAGETEAYSPHMPSTHT